MQSLAIYEIFYQCYQIPSSAKRIAYLFDKLTSVNGESLSNLIYWLLAYEKRDVNFIPSFNSLESRQGNLTADFGPIVPLLLYLQFFVKFKKTPSSDPSYSAQKEKIVTQINSFKAMLLNDNTPIKFKPEIQTMLNLNPEQENCFLSMAQYFIGLYYFKLADSQFSNTKIIEAAISYFEAAIAINPKNYFAHTMIGDAYMKSPPLNPANWNNLLNAKRKYDQAITASEGHFADAFNGLGNLYREQMAYKKAIIQYKRAIDEAPEFAYPKNYIGDCYRELNNHALAISYYSKAIYLEKDFVYAWYGIGKTLYDLSKVHNEIEFLIRAKEFFIYCKHIKPSFLYPYFDCARTQYKLYQLNDSQTTLKCVEQAYDEIQNVIKLSGKPEYYQLWEDAADNEKKEIETTKKLKSTWENINNNTPKDDQAKLLSSKINQAIIYNTQQLELNVDFNIKEFYRHFLYPTFEDEWTWEGNKQVYFEVLRNWNSFTPLVTDHTGGGYFVHAWGEGIVVDPGFSFLKNFKHASHRFTEIDRVLITHSHNDHCGDFESLLNLLFEYNDCMKAYHTPILIGKKLHVPAKFIKEVLKNIQIIEKSLINSEFQQEHNEESFSIEDFNEKQLKRVFDLIREPTIAQKMSPKTKSQYLLFAMQIYMLIKQKQHTIKVSMSKYTKEKFKGILVHDAQIQDLDCPQNEGTCELEEINTYPKNFFDVMSVEEIRNKFSLLSPKKAIKQFKRSTNFKTPQVFPIQALHKELQNGKYDYSDYAFGFVLFFEEIKVVIVISGDTAWEKQDNSVCLRAQYEKLSKLFNGYRIILVAHIGGFKKEEKENKYYPTHLGRLGLMQMIIALQPELCLISEFGEEFSGLRISLTNCIKKSLLDVLDQNKNLLSKDSLTRLKNLIIIPSDAHLKINLGREDDNGNAQQAFEVRVIDNVNFQNKTIQYKYVDPNDVGVGEVLSLGQLYYFNKKSFGANKIPQEALMEAILSNYPENHLLDILNILPHIPHVE